MSEAKYKTKYGEGLKTLTPKQMLQKFTIALRQAKAGNTSENSLNDIRQIDQKKLLRKYITIMWNQ